MRREEIFKSKIEVHGAEESKKVQLALFKLGMFWNNGHKTTPAFLIHPFLYIDGDGRLTYSDKTDRTYFRNEPRKEIKVRDILIPDWERILQE